MAMTMGGGNGPKADMNVTPMIDVLLVLLVIFMIVTPLSPNGLPVRVPQPDKNNEVGVVPPEITRNDLILSVHGDGTLAINQEPVELGNLRVRLAQIFQGSGDRVLFVRGDDSLVYEQVAKVIDVARGAGMTRVALLTTPVS